MRIPYLNTPCIVNETCFHGQCIQVEDFLIGWYEFCLCNYQYSGYECNEQTKLNRIDRFIITTLLIIVLSTVLCLLCIPFLYSILKHDFYPQIIECARTTPYVEVNSSELNNGMRIYRIPSEYLSRRRTIIDRLIPLHSISTIAYLTRIRNIRLQEQL